jgi:hypothetical protein
MLRPSRSFPCVFLASTTISTADAGFVSDPQAVERLRGIRLASLKAEVCMAATALSAQAHDLDTIIRAEFDEMPGMRLSMAQVARLWALTASDAHAAVRALVARGVLTLDARGRVCRPIDLVA